MSRRSIGEESIRKLTRTGRGKSYSLTLPINYVRKLGWREKQKVVVLQRGKTLLIKDWHNLFTRPQKAQMGELS